MLVIYFILTIFDSIQKDTFKFFIRLKKLIWYIQSN